MVEPAQMMKRDADLQDALVQAAHVTRLGAPQQFERLVLLEIVAAVELLDPFEQRRGRGLAARSAHRSGRSGRPGWPGVGCVTYPTHLAHQTHPARVS